MLYSFNSNQVLRVCRSIITTSRQFSEKQKYYEWKIPEGYNTGVEVENSYRSLTKNHQHSLVPFVVKDPKRVTWYACGPTVYDHTHIGHASSYVRFDAIRRILTGYFDLEIDMVMGITDIDDKILSRANLLNTEFLSLASHYEMHFKHDMVNLGVLPPTMYIRVSDVLPPILNFINRLLHNGHAYSTTQGNVWFDVEKFTKLGRLALLSGKWENSVNTGSDKINRKDFALWKAAKPGEPYWDAPWGKGRPGWHIECSAMASLVFGNKVDIHTGSKDLCFPHHECEILQSEAFHNSEQWVNYFLHAGHLKLKGSTTKMSKSIGNIITVQQFLETWSADDFRYFCLSTNWHSDLEYSEVSMKKYHSQIRKIRNLLTALQQIIIGNAFGNVDGFLIDQHLQECKNKVNNCLSENFHFPGVLTALELLQKKVHAMFTVNINNEFNDAPNEHETNAVMNVYRYVTEIYSKLGFVTLNAQCIGNDLHDQNFSMYQASDGKVGKEQLEIEINKTRNILQDWSEFRTSVRKFALDMKIQNKTDGNDLLQLCDNVRNKIAKKGFVIEDQKK